MNNNDRNAIISVYNKTNIVPFTKYLINKGYNIYSSGGTYKLLNKFLDNDKIMRISDITGFPEILNGRVKTLHPAIHGGILAKKNNDNHKKDLDKHRINKFDIVAVNLYPFEQVLSSGEKDPEILMENIDIGGVTLIRSAAKNYSDVLVLTDPNDYQDVMTNWENIDNKMYAGKAFHHTCQYDQVISSYFNDKYIYKTYVKEHKLKYGANPQQKEAIICRDISKNTLPFTILNGNPGYINILDAIYSWNLVSNLSNLINNISVASFKHNSPAGVAYYTPLTDIQKKAYFISNDTYNNLSNTAIAYIKARNVDPMSSFGDFLAISHKVDVCTAKLISSEVSDGIIAPEFDVEALNILKRKKGGRYIILEGVCTKPQTEIRDMHGVVLVQDENIKNLHMTDIPDNIPDNIKMDMILANTTLKYTQSNSVCSAYNGQVLGVGAGQQSRIDCVKLVKRKTEIWHLRQHPKVLDLIDNFKKGVKRTHKINAIMRYIDGEFASADEYNNWLNLFSKEPTYFPELSQKDYLNTTTDIVLASDAFFPFRDNIDVASQFNIKYIVQPGGSVADDIIINACKSYGIDMVLTGSDMRMFLH